MRKIRKPFVFLLLVLIFASMTPSLTANAEWAPPTAPTASAVYLINPDSNTVIYQKGADQKVYPASITKLMTAILTIEKFKDNLDTVVTVQKSDVTAVPYESSLMGTGLVANEQITVRQLLYGLLLPSGNDAALVLARAASPDGTVAGFVNEMNQKAKELGCTGTHYVNPHGIQDPDQYTTAKDVYLIAKYAMTDKTVGDTFSALVKTTSISFQTNKQNYQLTTTNQMLLSGTAYYYKYCTGIKTGSTKDAGECFVSTASNGGTTYYSVVMNSQPVPNSNVICAGAFADTKALYTWAFSTFAVKDIVDKGSLQAQVPITLAWNKTKLQLNASEQFNALIPATTDLKTIKINPVKLPETIMAPVKKDQKICSADVMLGDQKLGTINLVASETVDRSAPLYFVYLVGVFFGSIWFKVLSALLVLLLLFFFVLSFMRSRRKKNKRRRSKVYRLPR
jgi:serine-type D-Ala-D-Ala carboxypeptidase (penicillin-binding protein 5/6)